MLLRLALLAGAVVVSGCSRELIFGVDSTRSVISDLYTAQAVDNIGRFIDDRYAIPDEVKLGGGQASVSSTLGTGIAPNIAFRAIAVTGLSLTNTNLYSQNWGVSSVDDFDEIARLQLLYNYALGTVRPAFADFELRLSTLPPKIGTLSDTLGSLPPAGFIHRDGRCSSDNLTRTTSRGHVICFADNQFAPMANPKAPPGTTDIGGTNLTSTEVRSLFVLWTMAIASVAHVPPPKDATPPPAAPSRAGARSPATGSQPDAKNDATMVPPQVKPRQQFQLFNATPNLSIQ